MPAGYAGFNWDAGVEPAYWITDGYETGGYPGAVNGRVAILTPMGQPIGMQAGSAFDLMNLSIGAAWGDHQWAYLDGYLGATHAYAAHVEVPWGVAQTFPFGWKAIDRLVITPDYETGTRHPPGEISSHHLVLDDFVIEENAELTPEMSPASLLLVGMLPVGLAWWRRCRKS